MKWANVKLIWLRELRDQLRDRRTLFTVAVLPVLLYPLMGMVLLKVMPFSQQQPVRIWLIGSERLPESPPLLVRPTPTAERQFAGFDDEQVDATQRLEFAPPQSPADATAEAEAAIEAGLYDAVVYFPPDFSDDLADFQQAFKHPGGRRAPIAVNVPSPHIYFDTSRDKSRVARDRVEEALRRWREEIVRETFRASNIPVVITHPFDVHTSDLAELATRRALIWS
ncbi:MAG: hypothetical protein KDA41_15850, partial [Planctomycetales bacterium]|nr:hypothetical protein [Planctomycetales bacterium]